jgi:hypothetical protein
MADSRDGLYLQALKRWSVGQRRPVGMMATHQSRPIYLPPLIPHFGRFG